MSGLLIREQFVAVLPSLVRSLGNIEAAVILQHLHFLVGNDGSTGPVTAQQISDATGIALRTVQRRIAWLQDQDIIESERLTSLDPTPVHRINYDHEMLSSRDRQPDAQPVKLAVTSTKKEEHPPYPPKGVDDTEADFVQWYGMYPKKVDKGHARTAWRKATKTTDSAVIFAALRQQLPHLRSEHQRGFCPNPGTWLTGQRWEDDVGPASAPRETFRQRVARANAGGGP